jgi:hypothetical protein
MTDRADREDKGDIQGEELGEELVSAHSLAAWLRLAKNEPTPDFPSGNLWPKGES